MSGTEDRVYTDEEMMAYIETILKDDRSYSKEDLEDLERSMNAIVNDPSTSAVKSMSNALGTYLTAEKKNDDNTNLSNVRVQKRRSTLNPTKPKPKCKAPEIFIDLVSEQDSNDVINVSDTTLLYDSEVIVVEDETPKKVNPNIAKDKSNRNTIRKRKSSTVEEKSTEVTNKKRMLGDCPVCLEDMNALEILVTNCGHIYCTNCIKGCIKTTKRCPQCRKALTLKMCLEDMNALEILVTNCGHIYCTNCIKGCIKAAKRCPQCRMALTLKSIHPLSVN